MGSFFIAWTIFGIDGYARTSHTRTQMVKNVLVLVLFYHFLPDENKSAILRAWAPSSVSANISNYNLPLYFLFWEIGNFWCIVVVFFLSMVTMIVIKVVNGISSYMPIEYIKAQTFAPLLWEIFWPPLPCYPMDRHTADKTIEMFLAIIVLECV